MQKAAQLFNEPCTRIVIAAILLIAAAFAVAPDRRRIAMWVGLSAAGFLVAFRAVARISGRRVVGQIVIPVNREAAQAVVSRVLASYLDVTLIALLIGLVVAIIAFIAGPGRSRGLDPQLVRALLVASASTQGRSRSACWCSDWCT